MNNNFNVREYVEKIYGNEVVDNYEESFGLNGLDYLWSLESKDEVYEVLNDFI